MVTVPELISMPAGTKTGVGTAVGAGAGAGAEPDPEAAGADDPAAGAEPPAGAGAAAAAGWAVAGAELVSVPPPVSCAGAEEPQATETAAVRMNVRNRIANLVA
jgi:hypothetical protein